MFYLASPCCVQRFIVTYCELFSGILTPKSKTANFLLAACWRQNTAFVFCSFFFIETRADGEHVQQGGGGSPRWRHHQRSTDDLSTAPGCHQTPGGEGRWRLWQEDNTCRDSESCSSSRAGFLRGLKWSRSTKNWAVWKKLVWSKCILNSFKARAPESYDRNYSVSDHCDLYHHVSRRHTSNEV